MTTVPGIAMEVNSLLGNMGSVVRNYHQPDMLGSASNTVMDRIHYHPSSGGEYSQSYHKGGGKRSIALTALTLLSFLFFLHILQTCIQEQTEMMSPQVIIMQARLRAAQRNAEAEANKRIQETEEVDVELEEPNINKDTLIEKVDQKDIFEEYQYPSSVKYSSKIVSNLK